jgi:hypothetical protein
MGLFYMSLAKVVGALSSGIIQAKWSWPEPVTLNL